MNKINIKIRSNLTVNDMLKRLADLFSYKSIKYSITSNSINANRIPLPIINIDPRLYSKNNWIGINPFVFISSINILLSSSENDETEVNISISQFRSVVLYLTILFITGIVAINLPVIWGGLTLFVFIAIVSYIFIFQICIKYLIKHEISKVMEKDIGLGKTTGSPS